jgi:hypothetical protein
MAKKKRAAKSPEVSPSEARTAQVCGRTIRVYLPGWETEAVLESLSAKAATPIVAAIEACRAVLACTDLSEAHRGKIPLNPELVKIVKAVLETWPLTNPAYNRQAVAVMALILRAARSGIMVRDAVLEIQPIVAPNPEQARAEGH